MPDQPPTLKGESQKQKALVAGLNAAIGKYLRDAYGPPEKHPEILAGVAVGLLQISLMYFSFTGAPKLVISGLVEALLRDTAEPERVASLQEGAAAAKAGQES
jgi:hypothetical protein